MYRLICIAQAVELRKTLKPTSLQFLSRNNEMQEALCGLLFVNCFGCKTYIQKMTLSKCSFSGLNEKVFGHGKYYLFLPHSKHTPPHL